MSVYLSTATSQLKATLSSALTIGVNGQYIVSFCARIRTQINDFGMLVALVDQDPNSTISRRVFSDDDTPYDTVSGDAGPGGAAGPYQCVTDTWYGFVLYRNTSGTASLKIFPDSTSTTQLNSGTNSGDTAALSGLDTVLIGDIEPSARRACVMEIANLKIQTGIDVWDDTRCRYELDHFAFQSADGTERYAWELEDIDADIHGLNERGGAGPNFSVIAGTVAASANRPSQLEAAPASATTLYFLDSTASGSNYGSIQFEGSAPSTATTATGWTVDTVAAGNYALMTYGSERASSNFGSTAMPNAAPNNTTADCFRSSNVLSGDFATGVWTIAVPVIAVSAAAGQDGRVRVRLWRSTSATGASATEITSGAVAGTTVTDLTTGAEQVSTVTTSSITGFSMTAEYLFVQIAWEITGAAA